MRLLDFSVILLVTIISACAVPESPVRISGSLTFASGFDGIQNQSFPSGEVETLYVPQDHLWINSVADDGAGGVLYSAGWPGKAPYTIFHLKKGQSTPRAIRRGMEIAFSTVNRKLFYYYNPEDKLAESFLYVADPTSEAEPIRIAPAPKPIQLPNGIPLSLVYPPVISSQGKAFFLADDLAVKEFVPETSTLVATKLADCLPRAYRISNGTLLCVDWQSWNLHGFDLSSSKKVLLLPGTGPGLLYIHEYDAALFNKTIFRFRPQLGEIGELWLLDLGDRRFGRAGFGHFQSGFWSGVQRGVVKERP